jgi:hypothetical protein
MLSSEWLVKPPSRVLSNAETLPGLIDGLSDLGLSTAREYHLHTGDWAYAHHSKHM